MCTQYICFILAVHSVHDLLNMAQSDTSCVLPHIKVGVDTNTFNEEDGGTNLKSDILRALADLRFQPKPLCFINVDDRATFLHTILPSHSWPGKYDTTMEHVVNKKMAMPGLTAAEARGRNDPSRHCIGTAMVWKHMQRTPPPAEVRMSVAETDTPALHDKKEMFKLLQTVMVEPDATTMAWTHEMVKDWTKRACNSNEPDAKKQCLIQYPPILIGVEPTQGACAGTVRLVINDTFGDHITASILDANTVCVEGVHTPPGGNNSHLRHDDDIPRGPWKCILRLKEQVDTSVAPLLEDCNGCAGISMSLAPQGLKNAPVPLAKSQTRIANRLVRGTQHARPEDDAQC